MLYLIIIPVLVLCMWLMWRRSGNGATRACRWRLDRTVAEGTRVRQHCLTCGAETLTEGEGPPGVCLRGQGG